VWGSEIETVTRVENEVERRRSPVCPESDAPRPPGAVDASPSTKSSYSTFVGTVDTNRPLVEHMTKILPEVLGTITAVQQISSTPVELIVRLVVRRSTTELMPGF
jgi:hypothetical protein